MSLVLNNQALISSFNVEQNASQNSSDLIKVYGYTSRGSNFTIFFYVFKPNDGERLKETVGS